MVFLDLMSHDNHFATSSPEAMIGRLYRGSTVLPLARKSSMNIKPLFVCLAFVVLGSGCAASVEPEPKQDVEQQDPDGPLMEVAQELGCKDPECYAACNRSPCPINGEYTCPSCWIECCQH
jgi:hypothetical protein